MKNRNREMTEEKHNLCSGWKPTRDLKVGIAYSNWLPTNKNKLKKKEKKRKCVLEVIHTFSVKTAGSCKNNHPLYKPEFRGDVSFCCLCQAREHPPSHHAFQPTSQSGWMEGGTSQLVNRWKTKHSMSDHLIQKYNPVCTEKASCSHSSSMFL